MFRRRRNQDAEPVVPELDADEAVTDEADDDSDDVAAAAAPAARTAGPLDESEVAADDDVMRLDLGGLRVPGSEGMELRLDIDESTQAVVAVTVVNGASALQIMAFAAPRTEGIWDDVRGEIRASLASQGPVEEADGVFGKELLATLPVAGPQGQSGVQPVRFVGVDGPRWFVRGLFSGPSARSADDAAPLEAVLRSTVVVRGNEAMAPGDALTLHLPGELPPGMSQQAPGQGRTLPPPERGPEITEIR